MQVNYNTQRSISILTVFTGMKLIGSSDSKTTVYSNLTQLHNVLKHVDYIIDDSAAANFKTEFAYGDWLTAAGFNPNSNTYAFLTSQNVWRTDGLISKTGFSGTAFTKKKKKKKKKKKPLDSLVNYRLAYSTCR
jgi:hypothetical protein